MKPTELPEGLRVRDTWTPERQATVWGRVVRAQREQETTRKTGVVLGFFCLAALTAVGFFALVRSRTAIIALAGDEAPDDTSIARGSERLGPPPLAGNEGEPVAGAEPALPARAADPDAAGADGAPASAPFRRKLRFRDGSVAILRSVDTILEPVSVENHRIVNVLRAGAVRFEITKRPGRVFRVIGGEAIVEVLGTKFELERTGSRLRVDVTEGRVRVSWPGGERRLGRGESGLFPPEPTPRRRAQRVPRDQAAVAARADVTEPAAAPAPPSPAEPAAGDELGTLLRAADRARASGRALDAAAALRAAIERAPSDSRAPLAEFRLGRLLLEDLGKPGEAAAAFARVRALAPGGPLAPDALAREIESRAAAGDRATARTLARAYLSRYPNGSHAAWVRRWGATE